MDKGVAATHQLVRLVQSSAVPWPSIRPEGFVHDVHILLESHFDDLAHRLMQIGTDHPKVGVEQSQGTILAPRSCPSKAGLRLRGRLIFVALLYPPISFHVRSRI